MNYDINFVMNVTDIDDKIIKKSNAEQKPFTEVARHFENSFMDDMKALNVELPDALTRVSEFVPEIVEYIETIIKNGFAYESNGSVYFDVQAYKASHEYPKLEPTNAKTLELLAEGEGALAAENKDKKSQFDFVLWKASKEGEPKWVSPWGEGRPGWHIECSAMIFSHYGLSKIDIHSGGVDLKFPHHDNEIAQAEAFHQSHDWVNYWFHNGHLHIAGLKMSKSLKNFISIKKILEHYTARQVRILFLMHRWNSKMDCTPDQIAELNSGADVTNINLTFEKFFEEALEKERQFSEFFKNVKSSMRNSLISKVYQKYNEQDRRLQNIYVEKELLIHNALMDNFDTPLALAELSNLVKAANTYLMQPSDQIKVPLLRKMQRYVHRIL